MEFKILLFAKYMSVLFACFAAFCWIDFELSPKSEIRYVLAHDSETGYRSTSKFGASAYRDNFLYLIPFCAHKPYRLIANESDTLGVFVSMENRTKEALAVLQSKNQKSDVVVSEDQLEIKKIPVDLDTYYDLEDGDSMRLLVSPFRNKLVDFTSFKIENWLTSSPNALKESRKSRNPELNQWIFTSKVFALLICLLTSVTLGVKLFHIRVGMFVFNLVLTAMLYWVY